jgi:fatty-acyl-CoA synthase
MDLGVEIHAGYGMSETGPVMSLATPKEHMLGWKEDKKLDVIIKTGKPIPLSEFEGKVTEDDFRKFMKKICRRRKIA